MTDFALSAGNSIRPHRSPWGAFPVRGFKYSTGVSSAVINKGSVVCIDTAGSTSFNDCLIRCPISSGTLNPAAASIVGVATEDWSTSAAGMQNATSTTAGQQGATVVWEANPNVEFKAWTRGGLITSSIVGQTKELVRDSTLNIDLINLGASSLATAIKPVIITSLIDNAGDSGGAVTFRFNTSSGFLAFYR